MSNVSDGKAIAVVSDGCGGSKGMTDVGARIVAHSTKRALDLTSDAIASNFCRVCLMETVQQSMGLIEDDMLATGCYITAEMGADGGVDKWACNIAGDGVYAVRYADDSLFMSKISWAKNTPFYPAYVGERFETFKKHHEEDPYPVFVERWRKDSEFADLKVFNETTWSIEGLSDGYSYGNGIREVKAMGVFTDGITDIDGMDWKDAVIQAMSFKTTGGVFLKRRMGKIIRDSLKTGRGPMDDIAGAVIIRD